MSNQKETGLSRSEKPQTLVGEVSLWEVLVPATWDEYEIPLKYHQIWVEGVRMISGGLTILKRAKGQWVSLEGELFIEPMIHACACRMANCWFIEIQIR